MSTLKVGLMGCDRIARLSHLPILAHLPGVELVALVESDRAIKGTLRIVSELWNRRTRSAP